MAEQTFLAKLGLRLGVVGSSAALAIAAPIANLDYSTTANTAANRTGWYFDQTAAAEKIGMIVGGQVGPLFTRNGSVVDAQFTGQVTIGNGTAAATLALGGAAGTARNLIFQTAGVNRWTTGADNTAEGGADSGSNYAITAYTDAGAVIDVPISIVRAAGGVMTVTRQVTMNTVAVAAFFAIGSNAGTTRSLDFYTGASIRWRYSVNTTAESGSNAGSDFELVAYDDTAVLIDKPITIIRAALGAVTINRPVAITAGTLTGSQTAFNCTATWNNGASVFTGWLLNITDTASSTTSLLMDIQQGAATRFQVRKQGIIVSTIADTDLLATASYSALRTTTITGNVTDGVSIAITPIINGAFTVTRFNYLNIVNITGTSTITNGCALRFNAAAGTHKAVDSGTTKTTPTAVSAWMKINLNSATVFMPLYTSKTS